MASFDPAVGFFQFTSEAARITTGTFINFFWTVLGLDSEGCLSASDEVGARKSLFKVK